MESHQLISLALGAYMIITGLIGVFTKKLVGSNKNMSKYTVESIRKYAFVRGIVGVLTGTLFIVSDLLMQSGEEIQPVFAIGMIVAVVVLVVGVLVSGKVVLKEKD